MSNLILSVNIFQSPPILTDQLPATTPAASKTVYAYDAAAFGRNPTDLSATPSQTADATGTTNGSGALTLTGLLSTKSYWIQVVDVDGNHWSLADPGYIGTAVTMQFTYVISNSGGISRITSNNGSVTITNPLGPITDLATSGVAKLATTTAFSSGNKVVTLTPVTSWGATDWLSFRFNVQSDSLSAQLDNMTIAFNGGSTGNYNYREVYQGPTSSGAVNFQQVGSGSTGFTPQASWIGTKDGDGGNGIGELLVANVSATGGARVPFSFRFSGQNSHFSSPGFNVGYIGECSGHWTLSATSPNPPLTSVVLTMTTGNFVPSSGQGIPSLFDVYGF